jgi:hypothetical protein
MKAIHLNRALAHAAEQTADTLGDMTSSEAARSFGEKAKEVLTNKYVIGGLAAVAVAGAAYGTYRLLKKDDKAGGAANKEATIPEQLATARQNLMEVEARLKKDVGTKQTVAA